MADNKMKTFEEAAQFHGHVCPGLALGYRVGQKALEWLDANRSEDEEIAAVVENDSCAVDAIQVLTGCTYGKGNLIHKDTGKRVYTFFNRTRGKGIRIVEDYVIAESPETKAIFAKSRSGEATPEEMKQFEKVKERKIKEILSAPDDTFITAEETNEPPPDRAKIFDTLRCDSCGEKVMSPKAVRIKDKTLCRDCFDKMD